ncbi:bacteriophage holin [Legionella sp.]|uniref:bacteriophage holin n=1 Tax=Legionella sp. TaxID=459 RepID=UPI003CB053F1
MSGCKLSPVGLGLAFGVLWGISILFLGLVATYYAYGHEFVASMGNLYPGYTPSIKGSLLGGIIAFIDAFIMGFLIGWLYNKFSHCYCPCCYKDTKEVKKTTKK